MQDTLTLARHARAPRIERRRAGHYRLEVVLDYRAIAHRWRAMARSGASLAFQDETWLQAWRATLGAARDVTPLFVTMVDTRENGDVLGLPLVRRESGGLRVIEFADGGLTDYNAPVIGAGAPADAEGAERLWKVLLGNLPGADVLRLEKMPLAVRDIANPLALLDSARPSSLGGNILRVEGAWDDWHWGLERTFRKELERSWRVFERHEGASFSRVRALDDARRVFAALKQLQSARIGELGLPYTLDDPVQDAFYDRLVEQGLERGDVVLTALTAGDEIVAALLGVAQGDHYSMVRLGAAQGAWKNCSPGRLIIERTMKALHAEGFRAFDFTIGDYPYKRRLGAVGQPLVEIEKALSLSGAPRVALAKAKRAIRARPALANLARRLRAAK